MMGVRKKEDTVTLFKFSGSLQQLANLIAVLNNAGLCYDFMAD